MAITFYRINSFEDATVTVTSAPTGQEQQGLSKFSVDNNILTKYSSDGSADLDIIILIIEIPEFTQVDTLFLLGQNNASGGVQYYDTSDSIQSFSPNVAWTSWDSGKENYRVSVTEVQTKKLAYTATKTEPADVDKNIASIVATKKMFDLDVAPDAVTTQKRQYSTINQGYRGWIDYKKDNTNLFTCTLNFRNLGDSASQTDFNNILELCFTREPFIISLAGDSEGSRFPYRNEDIKTVKIVSEPSFSLSNGMHSGGYDVSITMQEVKYALG